MIRVSFYSGCKGRQRPSRFEVNGEIHSIVEVIEERITEDFHTRQRRRTYVVKTDRKELYELEENGEWNLRKLGDLHFA